MKQFKGLSTATSESYQYIVVQQYGAYNQKENADELLKALKTKDTAGYYKILKIKR